MMGLVIGCICIAAFAFLLILGLFAIEVLRVLEALVQAVNRAVRMIKVCVDDVSIGLNAISYGVEDFAESFDAAVDHRDDAEAADAGHNVERAWDTLFPVRDDTE